MPSLCGSAEATREWFRAFAAHSFLACRPLRPRGVRHRYPDIRCRHWPSPNDHRLGTPDTPAIRFARAVDFVASLVRFRYSLPGCSPPCTDQTGTPSLRGLLLPGFQRIGLPPRLLDITTTATGLLVWGFFCQEVSAERPIFLPSSVSLFDLKARFFVPDPPQCQAAARRSCQGWSPLRRPPAGLGLDSSEHGGTIKCSRAGFAS